MPGGAVCDGRALQGAGRGYPPAGHGRGAGPHRGQNPAGGDPRPGGGRLSGGPDRAHVGCQAKDSLKEKAAVRRQGATVVLFCACILGEYAFK